MGTIRRKLNAVREHWFQILIACLALALAFGLGMSFQADFVEDAAEESQIRSALLTFSRQMETFANDVDRMTRQAEQAEANREPADDPMENWVISAVWPCSGNKPLSLRTSEICPSPIIVRTPRSM